MRWIVVSVLSVAFCCAADAADTVRTIGVVANDLTFDHANGRFYVSVPSSVGAGGNSVRIIDPLTATAGASVFVGSEPNKIAVSDNGQYAYVGLGGAAAVRRVDLASFTAGLQFSLGSDSFLGPYYVEDMEVVPGRAQSVAISRRNVGYSPRHEGVAIYDDGVKRTTETPGHTGSNVIDFGGNAATLYGYNNETTDFGFRTMSISDSGVQTTNSTAGLISGFGADFDYGGGKVVSTTGRVIDPVNRVLLGTLNSSGPVAVEADGSRAYILSGNVVNVYDLATFLKIGAVTVPGLTGGTDLMRWGADGLALRNSNTVYLINSSVVPEPAALGGLLAIAVPLILRRTRARA